MLSHAQKVSTDVQFSLEVVSYIGCAISIVCLIITVVFFLLQGYAIYIIVKLSLLVLFDRKRLFDKVHYFVHLNLALALLLANLVFVSGIETATVNEVRVLHNMYRFQY